MKKDKIVYTYVQGEEPKGLDNNKEEIIKIRIEKSGRHGKSVTVISGFSNQRDLNNLASELKKLSGAGGTVKENSIEIQGEKKELIQQYLLKKGFKVK